MIKQLLQFIQNHWVLASASVAILALIIFEETKNKISGLPKVSAQGAVLLINRENAIVVDLRNQAAFSSGHILGAMNIAQADIDQNIKKLETHKNQDLILVDANDADAAPIGSKLHKAGFTKIHILAGGLQAWKEAQLPLSKN